jgi:rSAM/selenodomain-associated transferase 1
LRAVLMKTFPVFDPTFPIPTAHGLCALGVMTKAPQAGQVKTRLVPPLTPDEAAELNKCFLRDTAVTISSATSRNDASGIAVYTPIGCESSYDDILPVDFSLLPQRGVGFGERLCFAAQDLFTCGFDSVCLIDSDSPTVPGENFSKAIELLKTHGDHIVLGPSADGGYYLIGLKKPHRELFEHIDWSTERVFDQTVRRAREIGLEVKLLPLGYDVDDAASLRLLCKELLSQSTSHSVAPSTRKFLADIVAQKKL